MSPIVLKRAASVMATTVPLILCVLILTYGTHAAEKKKGKPDKQSKQTEVTETPVAELDPDGKPAGNEKKVDGARLFLWHENGVWKIRTRTKKDAHQFTGVIDIKGGKFKSISNYDGLEAGGKKKKKKPQDIGHWNAAKDKIDFNFRTVGAEDGFDFVVDKNATELSFDFKIDGYGHGRIIRVGGKEQMPAAAQFTLPAHPVAKDAAKDAVTK